MDFIALVILLATATMFTGFGIIKTRGKIATLEDFFMARNKLGLPLSILTLASSAMGIWILFSPPEATIRGGIIALIGYSLGSSFALFIFTKIGKKIREVMPNGHSLTEYAFYRFGKFMHLVIVAITIFYMAVYLTAELTGIGLIGKILFNVEPIITALIVVGLTLIYTAYGGFMATVQTAKPQGIAMAIFLVVLFVWTALQTSSNTSNKIEVIREKLNPFNINGIEYGLALIIAIVTAELFNQGNWQRVYSAKSNDTGSKAFFYAGVFVIPIIIMAGMFGLFALASNENINTSTAILEYLAKNAPYAVLVLFLILATSLVMSTTDSLLNGLTSVFMLEVIKIAPNLNTHRKITAARLLTIAIAVLSITVAITGYSVLYLFLVADLVCAAAAFPFIYGLYCPRLSEKSAIAAFTAGLLAGALFFPSQSMNDGNLFLSFTLAIATSAIVAIFLSKLSKKEYDFNALKDNVKALN